MHRVLTSLFLVLVLGCASSARRPAAIARPELDVRVVGGAYFGSGSTAPATVELDVQNAADVPIVVRRVEIDSPGMTQYRVVRTSRTVRETVPAGGSTTIGVMVPVERRSSQLTEPLTLRAIVDFEAGDDRWREIVMTR